ncbi:lactate utilization protein B/C [Echinicola strongylocentroti]|uniref:Lactate utilization protein B/C n=1 Tax=Echinicola strongylocentroti TaxID=1795355 RepID=A0A2Z4IKN4_9BACT|nr:LUD domain-containing protein [Echinicola strongylocentroti]AWW31116.1 lactate utilization protein B/C [Echinicola strongylocentroti]
MSSKEAILGAIKKNKPAATPLPDLLKFPDETNLIERYEKGLTGNGGKLQVVDSLEELEAFVRENYASDQLIASLVDEVNGNVDVSKISDPHDLEHVELAILKGELGVSENGAIWMPEKNVVHRVLPFIAQHLIIVIREETLLTNMHDAYEKVNVADGGYGVFIAGPSKTADIEQSLVIGAHGPRSLTVFLLKK